MFDRAVAALKAAEQAIVADLDQLWVPFDPATGSGGLHWHGAGAGALIESYKSVVGVRATLEAKEPPTPAAESVTPEEAPVSDVTAVEPEPEAGPEPVESAPAEESVTEVEDGA